MGNSGGTRLTLSVPMWDSAQDGLRTSTLMARPSCAQGHMAHLGFRSRVPLSLSFHRSQMCVVQHRLKALLPSRPLPLVFFTALMPHKSLARLFASACGAWRIRCRGQMTRNLVAEGGLIPHGMWAEDSASHKTPAQMPTILMVGDLGECRSERDALTSVSSPLKAGRQRCARGWQRWLLVAALHLVLPWG